MDPNEQTYEDVQRMVSKLAWTFTDRRKRDQDECLAVANLGYAKAYSTFDPARGISFTTYCYACVRNELRGYRGRQAEQYTNEKQVESLDRSQARGQRHVFDRVRSELSDDARLVVEMVITTPSELLGMFRSGKASPARKRQQLWARIREELGWNLRRTVEAFDEIREAVA